MRIDRNNGRRRCGASATTATTASAAATAPTLPTASSANRSTSPCTGLSTRLSLRCLSDQEGSRESDSDRHASTEPYRLTHGDPLRHQEPTNETGHLNGQRQELRAPRRDRLEPAVHQRPRHVRPPLVSPDPPSRVSCRTSSRRQPGRSAAARK